MATAEKLTVIFPIETISRELDGRLLLASLFGREDHRILLAHSSLANRIAAKLKSGGLYVGKHIMGPTAKEPSFYYRAKENKFVVVQSAEEGAVFMGQPKDWSIDLDVQLEPKVLAQEDYVATWGEWQRNYYLKQGASNPENVRATGHPRFELCKERYLAIYQEESEQLKKRFGRYILINANFSCVTHRLGMSQVFSAALHYHPDKPELRHKFVEQWAYQMQVVQEFVKLVHRLVDRLPELSIVVRPHPDDDLEYFRGVFGGLKKVHVVREGTVFPWILGSELLIHDGCTTGIEAFLAKKPVLSFTPVKSEREIFLPNSVGIRAVDPDEALSKIIDLIKEPVFAEVQIPELAHDLFSNFRQDSEQKFLSVLSEAESIAPRSQISIFDAAIEEKKAWLLESVKRVVRPLFKNNYRAAAATKALFPGFNKAYIQKRLDKIGAITGRQLHIQYFGGSLVELGKEI